MKKLLAVLSIISFLLFFTTPKPSALEYDMLGNYKTNLKHSKYLKPKEIPILMYHSISDSPGGYSELVVSPEEFAKQMDYLVENNYVTITLKELYQYEINKITPPLNLIVITFDDGYVDNFNNAYPILKDREMKAVVFPYVKKIDTTNGLSQKHLLELLENGWEIGCHTVNHIDLTNANSRALAVEVKEAKNMLEDMFNTKVISFCYPAGKYDAQVVDKVDKVDYQFALTTNYGRADLFGNQLLLSRIRINRSDSVANFARKVS